MCLASNKRCCQSSNPSQFLDENRKEMSQDQKEKQKGIMESAQIPFKHWDENCLQP